MITLDFSNWANELFDYSIELLTYRAVLEFDNQLSQLMLNSNSDSIFREWSESPVEAHVWWLAFGAGIECLAKATLLKHHALPLTKRDFSKKISNCSNQKVKDIYKAAFTTQVSADTNLWLDSQLKEINAVWEIDTGTLGNIYGGAFAVLKRQGKIDPNERKSIEEYLQVFTDIRRNVDAHIYLKTRVVGSINGDLEQVYIPLANLLTEVFYRS